MRNMVARVPVAKFRHSYSSTNVTTAAWVELLSAITQPASAAEIFDSSGRILKLAQAALGEEDANEMKYYIVPGGSSILLPLEFAKNKRLAIRAVDATADSGDLIINFFA